MPAVTSGGTSVPGPAPTASVASRWAGVAAAALIAVGGLGAGSTRRHDPLLEAAHLSWLRFGHGLVFSSVLLWAGVALMLAAWLAFGRRVAAGATGERDVLAHIGWWLAPLLVSVPVFSRDAYSYLAQGALLRDGIDPYLAAPVDNPNALLDEVSSNWTATVAPYGPGFLLLARAVATITGDNPVTGTMLLRLFMLPGLALLILGVRRVAHHLGGDAAAALFIGVLNPLVLIHLVGGVHNEMLMVGLMAAGVAMTLDGRHVTGLTLVTLAVAIKATAVIALPFLVWVWTRRWATDTTVRSAVLAVAAPALTCGAIVLGVFGLLSAAAGVGPGWVTALRAGNSQIINWLTVPTATANVIHAVGGLFTAVDFPTAVRLTRLGGITVIVVVLPLLWWRGRHDDRGAVRGIAEALLAAVLFAPAGLPWYATWPLSVGAPLIRSRSAIATVAAVCVWVMVIFKPDGAHGMYSLIHVLGATAAALWSWRFLGRSPGGSSPHLLDAPVSTPSPAPAASPLALHGRAGRRPAGRCRRFRARRHG